MGLAFKERLAAPFPVTLSEASRPLLSHLCLLPLSLEFALGASLVKLRVCGPHGPAS